MNEERPTVRGHGYVDENGHLVSWEMPIFVDQGHPDGDSMTFLVERTENGWRITSGTQHYPTNDIVRPNIRDAWWQWRHKRWSFWDALMWLCRQREVRRHLNMRGSAVYRYEGGDDERGTKA